MKLFNQRPQGFSLVELMVVVAIIGILASIAVPNFQRYQSRARQSEAKIALAGLYSAEVAFGVDQGSYTTCIRQAGYEAAGQQRLYGVGFKDTGGDNNCGVNADQRKCYRTGYQVGGTFADCGAGDQFYPATAKAPGASIPARTEISDSNYAITSSTFIAGAVGTISSQSLKDQWSIDETKNLKNTTLGM